MPKTSKETREYHLRLLRGIILLFVTFVTYTEVTPTGVICGQMGVHCQETVTLYANAVEHFKERNGRLPLSLDQLVPYDLPEQHLCQGDYLGCRPETKFGIMDTLKSLTKEPVPPQRPDYNIVHLMDGTITYQILCNREHPERVGMRGDSGQFFVYDQQKSIHIGHVQTRKGSGTQLASQ